MTGPVPYLFFAGEARAAMTFFRHTFGGELQLNSFAEFERTDGPPDAIAHAVLTGAVTLYAADVAGDQHPLHLAGVSFALLGVADAHTLAQWFASLSNGGAVVDPLQERAWGAHDGTVVDRFGVQWLIGWEN